MRLALYCPVYGFYEKEEDRIGRNGDFYTSVSVGNLFGELLAFQFAEWLPECQSETRPVQIVEAGAHRGDLARDILIWLRDNRPELFQSLQYVIIEPSAVRQKSQNAILAEFGQKVSWVPRNTQHAIRFRGIIFSNELLDAMPVRRFGWDAKKSAWFEWGVTLNHGKFAWTSLEVMTPPIETNKALLAVLPNGFTFEKCPEAVAWWQNAALTLERGRLMTIDYGMTTDELILPERTGGTLRAYYRHHTTSDLLANPGEQDLTAHVNFSEVIATGEANGLKTERFETQAQFLTQIVSRITDQQGSEQWLTPRARQFQSLTHPEHLGRSFRVLVQSRNPTP
jgi:SAM-dependent MidA family methyltransferase